MRPLPLLTLIVPVALGADLPVIGPNAATAAAEPAAVSIVEPRFKPPQSWTYEPSALTVTVGTKVTWTNTGAVIHTATADDGKTFNSGNIRANASFSFTPNAAGTFPYHCIYHPWMKGAITVQP